MFNYEGSILKTYESDFRGFSIEDINVWNYWFDECLEKFWNFDSCKWLYSDACEHGLLNMTGTIISAASEWELGV